MSEQYEPRIVRSRVKIKGVLQGEGVMASDSEPGNFFSFDPQIPPPGIKISTQTDPLGKHTETFKITNKIAFIMISKSAKSLQTHRQLCTWAPEANVDWYGEILPPLPSPALASPPLSSP